MWAEQKLPEEWTKQTIAQLGGHSPTTVQTGPFGAQLHSEDYVDEGVPFILIRNLQENSLDTSDMPHITYEDARRLSLYRLEPGDIVFSRVGRVGSCFLVGEEQAGWVISGQMLRIRLPEDSIDRCYLIHALRSKPAQDQITGASVGSTRQSINTQILESLSIVTPPLPEQRRIAEILDAGDEAIWQTERVITKLKAVKAGLLDDLLTRGLDEHGHLRDPPAHPEQFKDSPLGRIPREWEVVRCTSICHEITVGIVIRPSQYYVSEGIPALRSANVREDGVILDDLVFISEESNRLLAKSRLKQGDVITVRTGYPGTSCVVPPELDGANCIDLIISRLGPRVIPEYLATWINSDFGKGQVLRSQGGLAQQHFNVGALQKLLVALPRLDEQNRIAAILDAHDARIRAEERELAKLRQIKRGLMDDLLSGRVRVT